VLLGSPAPALLDAAEGWDADLVVVGSQGRSAIGRVLLGSVSKQVATESSRSVLVSRYVVERGEAPPRIIVAIDGSAGAVAAAEVIEARTWPSGTMVRVVAETDSSAAHLQNDGDIVEKMAARFRRAGLEASVEFKRGSAQRVLCDEAASWEADCIFVGSGALGTPGERVRMGSLAAGLVTSAPCSVEVVRTRENAPEPGLG
jgi:nucleotide-binding universal stress UspA family protein